MNYLELYQQLVQFRKSNILNKQDHVAGEIESHHILPRSCGGSDDPENLVNLYAKEHFMAHYYLWKIHENDEFKHQMLNAFWMMCIASTSNQNRTYQEFIKMSEEYQEARIQFIKQEKVTMLGKNEGNKNGQFGKHWYYDPLTNKSHRYVDGKQPTGWILGRKCLKLLGKKLSEETKKKISETNKKNGSSIGKKNSQYGTMWIHNEKTHEFKKIHKTDLIPIGWKRGTGWLGWGKGKAYK